jgi:hypothetical protein
MIDFEQHFGIFNSPEDYPATETSPFDLANQVECWDPRGFIHKAKSIAVIGTLALNSACQVYSRVITPEPKIQPTDAVPWEYSGLVPIDCESDRYDKGSSSTFLRLGNGASIVFRQNKQDGLLHGESTHPEITEFSKAAPFRFGFSFNKGLFEYFEVGNCKGYLVTYSVNRNK